MPQQPTTPSSRTMPLFRRQYYSPLPSSTPDEPQHDRLQAGNSSIRKMSSLAGAFLAGFCAAILVKVNAYSPSRAQPHHHAPILDAVDMDLSTKVLNGALWDNTSIWRMPPSPDVDAAWRYISGDDMQLISVSRQDVIKSGKDPSVCVKAPESWGLGGSDSDSGSSSGSHGQQDKEAYIAQIQVFHQIHCLDELRKEIYYDAYYPSPPTALHQSHKSHCVHMLLQALMCGADVGIITHNWIHDDGYAEPKTRPFPDFNVGKKCRNFTRVMDWLRNTAGIRDLEAKFPMTYPGNVPIVPGKGYSMSSISFNNGV